MHADSPWRLCAQHKQSPLQYTGHILFAFCFYCACQNKQECGQESHKILEEKDSCKTLVRIQWKHFFLNFQHKDYIMLLNSPQEFIVFISQYLKCFNRPVCSNFLIHVHLIIGLNLNSVINHSPSCHSRTDFHSSSEHKWRFWWNLRAFCPSRDSYADSTSLLQKVNKEILKLIHMNEAV